MKKSRYTSVEDEGVYAIGLIVAKELAWIFRDQPKADMGIDAHVEVCENRNPLGKLIALQIKSGESWFREETSDGYIYRGSLDHLEYWAKHSLPVLVVLYNPEKEKAFWQVVTNDTVTRTKKGWKITVPQLNVFDKHASLQLRRIAKDSPAVEKLKSYRFTLDGKYLDEAIYKLIVRYENERKGELKKAIDQPVSLTGYQMLALKIISSFRELGVSVELLRELYTWLSQEHVMQSAIRLVETRYQAYLIMGADGKPAIWSAFDLADYLYLGAEKRTQADVLVCINKIVYDFFSEIDVEIEKPIRELVYAYREYVKNIEYVWDDR